METYGLDSSDGLKRSDVLWEKYKYRHGLIWQRIFKFTTAFALISIIPFVQERVVIVLGY